ncbi:hypothetical protein N5P37_003364 [Trichoderma harzianum]|nr:hypothetical protein N5P37_003364 [Trichoderma harzianum]
MPEDYRNGTTTLLRDRKKASFSGENAVCYIMTRGNISYAAGTGSRAGANTPRAAPQSKVVIIPLLLESGSHAGTAGSGIVSYAHFTEFECVTPYSQRNSSSRTILYDVWHCFAATAAALSLLKSTCRDAGLYVGQLGGMTLCFDSYAFYHEKWRPAAIVVEVS